ncbi:DUF1499 domain-containing protein [Brevundimonas sp. S30B]|uniref:DUF1499 domain-containing protein n=1 Tax=unclassified Brevundimonas TaxID=2622653 RepID=UPI00107203F3|nr:MULTISPECIES: DUF1499 domain-containing protein [unclassified Brevundimonas]QBX38247.1 DUF1499 domain-containing protein [Brevundimonas sp. MF30-B]TFW01616.1 DUF1499 domain-containing protein [Brevundimonas sp. S30B]
MADPAADKRAQFRLKALVLVAALPLIVTVVAVFGGQFGLFDVETARGLLVLTVVRGLVFVALFAALAAVLIARVDIRDRGVWALAALVLAAGSALVFFTQAAKAVPGPNDVTTDPADPPSLSRQLMSARTAAGASPLGESVACDGLEALPTQVAPEVAGWAVRQAGFNVIGFAAFRAEGDRDGYFFGLGHDAVVRIRPGRTDVRVIARHDQPQGDVACRLARRILDEMTDQTSR